MITRKTSFQGFFIRGHLLIFAGLSLLIEFLFFDMFVVDFQSIGLTELSESKPSFMAFISSFTVLFFLELSRYPLVRYVASKNGLLSNFVKKVWWGLAFLVILRTIIVHFHQINVFNSRSLDFTDSHVEVLYFLTMTWEKIGALFAEGALAVLLLSLGVLLYNKHRLKLIGLIAILSSGLYFTNLFANLYLTFDTENLRLAIDVSTWATLTYYIFYIACGIQAFRLYKKQVQ